MAVFVQAQTFLRRQQAKHRELTSAWVTAREAFWIALEALRVHKLRSFLTLLGIVIATTTLIVVMSVVNGMNLYIADHIANLGANVFILHQFKWVQTWEEFLKARRRNKPIRIEDYQFLKENLRGFKNMGAETFLGDDIEVRCRGQSLYGVSVGGDTPSMIDIGQVQVEEGRFFTESEYEHAAPVCFIGQDLVDNFFPGLDAVGKEIQIRGTAFRIVGVARKIGSTFGQSEDNFVNIPLTTLHRVFTARPNLGVNIQAWDVQQMAELQDETRALMRARHHLPYREDDDFGINSSDTIMDVWRQLTGTVFAVMIGVVAVFMVVGGIVIMNIMLASVTERTHEIGIRKSLGARRRDILTQFVIESGVMAAAGGVLGILVAFILNRLVNIFFTATMPLSAIVIGIVLSASVGLFFGIYPASRAAKLDPIEALRTET